MEDPPSPTNQPSPPPEKLHGVTLAMFMLQFILMALCALTFEDTYRGRVCMHASIGNWFMVGIIAHQRAKALTRVDVLMLTTGIFLLIPVAMAAEAAANALFSI